jgi:drug/metabolite transporter (DMT)-like permease
LAITALLVLGRIVAASWSNVLQKRAINDSGMFGQRPTALEMLVAIWTLMTLALAPWWGFAVYQSLVAYSTTEQTDSSKWFEFWGWMTLACALEVPGNFLLLRSIQRTDLSIFGPLSSYKPIVGMLLGWFVLAESPTALGLIGMAIVLGGSLLLTDRLRSADESVDSLAGSKNTGVQDRLIAVALTAAGSIFLKLAMQHQSALSSLAAWSFISWLMALTWLVMKSRFWRDRRSSLVPRFILIAMQPGVIGIAATMIAMQWLTILVFQAMHVGYALALFQLGSLLSVYLGHRLFGEIDFFRRLIAATIMFIGAACIVLAG